MTTAALPSSPAAPDLRAMLALAAGQTLLGTLGVFVVESGLDPVTVAFWRCVIGVAVLAAYGTAAGRLSLRGVGRRALLLAVLSGVLMAANWVVFFAAIGRVGIAVATIVFHVQPFLVVLLGAALLGERPSAARLAWVALAFAGLLAAVGPDALRADSGPGYRTGVACALAGAALYAGVTLIAKRLGGMWPPQLVLIQCAVGAPLLLVCGPLGPDAIAPGQWGWLAGIGLVHTGLVYALVYGALPGLATPVIAVLLFLYPASAVTVDAVVFGRLIGPGQAAGLGLIVIASLGVTLGWRFGFPKRRPVQVASQASTASTKRSAASGSVSR